MEHGIVGVDVGGTNTVIGIFDSSLTLLEKVSIQTLKPNLSQKTSNPAEFFDQLSGEVMSLKDKAGLEHLLCVGIGVPGKVNPGEGTAIHAVNLGYDNVPFADEMTKRLGVPVFIDNDVRNYTRGEAIAGSAKGFQNVICVTLGTGMAAGVMIERNIICGSNFFAGEIGHDIVPGEHSACNCGKRGCLETVASASGISRLATEAVRLGKETIMSEFEGPIQSKTVYSAALKGDKIALEIFQYVGQTLASKLVTASLLLNPEIIVIGGGAAAAGSYLLNPIKEVFLEQLGPMQPLITVGSLGDSAGLYGSADLANSKYQKSKSVKERTIL
ncbi:ROK family protein [Neobacillus cucumis]|uniref:ROK family protein n=1 Tax=Neobacillus cucumis TaxID=1740721 RepID=A0A2N5HIK2_9BACI|nr:ROK family protein [Neobacillus cucumis]PLS05351.1 ROK family protein [Neobacillus cucumis]